MFYFARCRNPVPVGESAVIPYSTPQPRPPRNPQPHLPPRPTHNLPDRIAQRHSPQTVRPPPESGNDPEGGHGGGVGAVVHIVAAPNTPRIENIQ